MYGCVNPGRYAEDTQSSLVNNLPSFLGLNTASRRIQRTYWLISLGLDQLSFDFIAPLREFLWGTTTRGSFFARTIVPAAGERARGRCTPTPTVAWRGSRDTPQRSPLGWTYTTGNVERLAQDSPKSMRNVHATAYAGGVGRMGVAQLLSAVKPANRGSQTPLRTAARSYFDVSLPPSGYPVASNLPLAQFIAWRTWSNSFLPIVSSYLNIMSEIRIRSDMYLLFGF